MGTSSIAWLDSHLDEIQERFAGKFIAVVNDKVIAVGDSFEETLRKAKRLTDDEILINFVDRG
ncbi:MAG TPA: DUF5678 domain-containing protein, partial [Candidatus Hodarchaeales archaeon]|nr:DUF5678 domain-containing protein [Candidatus Hodarchaeales archaeon]